MGLWLKQDGELVPVSGGSTGADGKGWTGGTYDPATGTVTFTSDDGLEFTTGDLRGADGIDGLDGTMWHVGSGDPASTLGDPGDYYLDGEAGWVWVKRTDTSWTNLYVNLTGPPGEGAGEHDHDYAATGHTHSYSPTSHTHDKVGGLGLAGVAVPPSGAQIVRSGTNGYTYLGWLNTVSGATTGTPTRIYTNSGGSDSFVRYMTPANFRAKVTDGSYSATGHGHSYLPLSGGSVTGNVSFRAGTSAVFYDNYNNLGSIWHGRASNNQYALVVRSSASAVELQAGGANRAVYASNTGLWAPGVYATTTAAGNHVRVTNANGGIQRSTNSRAHLKQIEPARRSAVNSVLDLEPVWYRSNCEGDNPDLSFYGFISEDVAEVDERFVNFTENEDGVLEPGDVNYGAITALLVSVVKEQRDQIAELTARLEQLEA